MTDYLLGIDLGTSAVKTLVMDVAGMAHARASASYPILHPHSGWAEQDPHAWWQAAVAAVRECTAGMDPSAIIAIGLSGQMHGTVLLDDRDEPIAPAVIWPDQRSAAQVQTLTAAIGATRLVELAGSPLATGFMAATIAWLQAEQPDMWARTAHLLLPKDYVRLRLTGQLASDPSDGSGTLLLNVQTRAWSAELLAALDMPPDRLPALAPAASLAGELTARAVAELGLQAGTPVAIGAADTACSALGAGAVDPGALLLTLSTGGQLLQPVAAPAVDRLGRIHTFCSACEPAAGPGWYQMGAILSAGNALRWLRDNVLGLSGPDAYDRMMALAAPVPMGADGLLFLPYLAGERTPHMDPTARGLFSGLTLRHGQGELVRAVLEGVTLACYDAFQPLAELGAQPASIILAGGGAQSPFWRQMVADIFGLPVRPLAVAEQSAVGATLLAGAALGQFDLVETARAWAQYGPPVVPDAGAHQMYGELFARFQSLYARNRGQF